MNLRRAQKGKAHHDKEPTTHSSPSIISLFELEEPGYVRNAEEWPTFLYEEQVGWSDKDIKHGLFQGHVLSRVCSPLLFVYQF